MDKELVKRVAQFVEDERRSCSMDFCDPLYVSRMLYISIEDATEALKEIGEIR